VSYLVPQLENAALLPCAIAQLSALLSIPVVVTGIPITTHSWPV